MKEPRKSREANRVIKEKTESIRSMFSDVNFYNFAIKFLPSSEIRLINAILKQGSQSLTLAQEGGRV